MTIVDKIKAYKAAVEPVSNSVLRYPMSTADAMALMVELGDDAAKSEVVKTAVRVYAESGKEPESVEGKIKFYTLLDACSKAFWREVSGTVVEGVEVIRSK